MQKSVTVEADKMAQEVKVLATTLEFSPQTPRDGSTDSQELFSELHACTQRKMGNDSNNKNAWLSAYKWEETGGWPRSTRLRQENFKFKSN